MNIMHINVFEPKSQFQSQKKEIINAVKKVFKSGKYILGKEVLKLEKKFSSLHQVKYGVAVKNGTDAISISLKALGVEKGDEVITTSHTALATIAAIISTGATPVIIDIEKDLFTINANLIEKKINKKTKAIIPVHIYGQCADMQKICKIANKYKLFVIEDCAQAHGAKIKNKSVGSFGHISTFSFYPTKNLGAIGDGGIVLTNNLKLKNKIKKFREYGWDSRRYTNEPGINSRLDEVQASILNIKLKNFTKSKQKRIAIANKYLRKIKNDQVILPKIKNDTTHVFHIFSIMVKNKTKFVKFLNQNKIFPGFHYKILAHQNNGYSRFCKFKKKELIFSNKISKHQVSLPIYPELTYKNINNIIKVINSFK